MRHFAKKPAVLFAVLLLCAATFILPASASESNIFLLGDADVDSYLSIADVTAIQRAQAQFNLLSFKGENLGDVDRDGFTDIVDATLLQRWHAQFSSCEGIGEPVAPRTMVFQNGEAQQIVRYSDARQASYLNTGSDIIRYTVYVETDCDTDLDGKPDLVKAWVQVPRPAAEGDYQAPVIYEARPYCAGTDLGTFTYADSALDESLLQSRPEKRVPAGTATTEQVAAQAVASDWYYRFSSDIRQTPYYSNLTTYNYYLVRGFAVVGCAGLGTYGSEGIELCGTSMEADAFKAVVEWLHGDRIAYSDAEHNIAVTADWSSGRIGMTGRSYAGTMAYEVATTGVEGLETVVPVAGIASWYDYSNSQGAPVQLEANYTAYLSAYCASRLFENFDKTAYTRYTQWLTYAADTQKSLDGDYGDFWANRDFSAAGEDLHASALIVHGLNDDNVCTKHFDLMWQAYERSDAEHKALLHQNDHITPANESDSTDIMIGDCTYAALLNRWFSHYLADVDNSVVDLPALTVQSNTDGKFYPQDEWNADGQTVLRPDRNKPYSEITAQGAHENNLILTENTFTGQPSDNAALWSADVTEAMTLKGSVEVKLRVKTDNINTENTNLSAALVDTADEPFSAYIPNGKHLSNRVIGSEALGTGMTSYKLVEWLPTTTNKKIVATGTVDLKTPGAGYLPQTAVAPDEPVRSGEWYEYTLFLQPNLYTVAAGHRLELYILPYVNGVYDNDIGRVITGPMLTELGYHPNYLVRRRHDYSFTVDNSQSYAVIPIA